MELKLHLATPSHYQYAKIFQINAGVDAQPTNLKRSRIGARSDEPPHVKESLKYDHLQPAGIKLRAEDMLFI